MTDDTRDPEMQRAIAKIEAARAARRANGFGNSVLKRRPPEVRDSLTEVVGPVKRITPEEYERQARADQASFEAHRAKLARDAARLPPRVREILDGITMRTPALEIVDAWSRGKSRMLFLCGPKDSGKSVALGSLVTLSSRWIYQHELDAKAIDRDWWREVEAASLLLVDDLGVEGLTERSLGTFHHLVDRAYDGWCRLAVTANLTAQELSARYLAAAGGRLLDRVRERGQIAVVGHLGMRPQSLDVTR